MPRDLRTHTIALVICQSLAVIPSKWRCPVWIGSLPMRIAQRDPDAFSCNLLVNRKVRLMGLLLVLNVSPSLRPRRRVRQPKASSQCRRLEKGCLLLGRRAKPIIQRMMALEKPKKRVPAPCPRLLPSLVTYTIMQRPSVFKAVQTIVTIKMARGMKRSIPMPRLRLFRTRRRTSKDGQMLVSLIRGMMSSSLWKRKRLIRLHP